MQEAFMRRFRGAIALLTLVVVAAACGSSSDDDASDTTVAAESGGELTVYSGRSEELVGPLIEMFEEQTGIRVNVRYGDTAELAAQILEEGDNSPADVFFAQDAGALGAVSAAGRFEVLPDEVLDQVAPAFRSTKGEWVGVSARARVVVYNTEALTEDELPDSILDLTDPQWSGRIGWAPTNGSFQAFVTALRVLEGEDGARNWLEAMEANGAQAYENNTAIVEAVANGEIDAGLVNHYYLFRTLAEDPSRPAANKFYSDGDPGALVNVAGAGILGTSDRQSEANTFVAFLLSEEAQQYFATETFEIPLAEGVEPADGVPDLATLTVPELDLDQLADLEGTLALLQEVGVL
jgi:iron(III) transport system substrate-binding protein